MGEPLSGVPGTPAAVASATRFWRSAIWSSLACSLASISAFSVCVLISSASALLAFASAAVALCCAAAKSVSRAFSFFSLTVRARSEISRAEMLLVSSLRKPLTLLVFKNPKTNDNVIRSMEIPIKILGMGTQKGGSPF